MPHFWKVDPTRWVNTVHIVYVEDHPHSNTPFLEILMLTVDTGARPQTVHPYTVNLIGEAREEFLAYLARETESPPSPASA